MIRNRLILTLLIDGGLFVNSRNFNLQKIINLNTIVQHLNFEAIDELIILNVSRKNKSLPKFCSQVKKIARNCFVPISAGGGINSIEDFHSILRSGADKVIINSAALENPSLIIKASKIFGSQCVVLSIDVKKEGNIYRVYSKNGLEKTNKEVVEWSKEAEKLGAGEIFLTSIDNDGRGQGYDLELVKKVSSTVAIPVIASGGVGEFQHLVDGITKGQASAVSLANLFHFIGYSLVKAKQYLQDEGLNFPKPLWNF